MQVWSQHLWKFIDALLIQSHLKHSSDKALVVSYKQIIPKALLPDLHC